MGRRGQAVMESQRRPEPTLRGALTLDSPSKVCEPCQDKGADGLCPVCRAHWMGPPWEGAVSSAGRRFSQQRQFPRVVCQQHLGTKSFTPKGADHQSVHNQ